MKKTSKRTEKSPRPNLVGSPKIELQSSKKRSLVISIAVFSRTFFLTVVVRQYEHLHQAEQPAGEVEEDVAYAPPHGALPPVVHPGLRDVLDQRHRQLGVGARVEKVQPGRHRGGGEDQDDGKRQGHAHVHQAARAGDGLKNKWAQK